jgi:perosamine synthetase
LDKFIEQKRKLAFSYLNFFNNTEIKFIKEPLNSISNYWLCTILFKDQAHRDEFLSYSNDNGVMTRPTWKLMSNLKMFKNSPFTSLDNSKFLESRLVNIPSSVIL